MMTTDPVGFARLRTIALVLGMVAIFSAASAAQAQSAPAGNEKVQTQAISAAGEAVNPFGEGSSNLTDIDRKREFAKQVNLRPLRDLAVFHNGRVKILETLARETVSSMLGRKDFVDFKVTSDGKADKHHYDPLFTYLDMMIDPRYYYEKPLIHVEYLPLREAYLERIYQNPSEIEWWKRLGRLKPMDLVNVGEQVETSFAFDQASLRSRAEMREAFSLYNESWRNLLMVAPADAQTPWHHIGELKPGTPAAVALQDLTTAWRALDAAKVNDAASRLALEIPRINAGQYPTTKRSLEAAYNRANAFEWGYWLYALSLLTLLLAFGTARRWLTVLGVTTLFVALALHFFGFAARSVIAERYAIQNQFESMTGLSLFAVIVGCVIMLLRRQWLFGAAAAGVGFMTLITATQTGIPGMNVEREAAILNTSVLLKYHVTTVLFSYGLIALGFMVSLFYLGTYYANRARLAPAVARASVPSGAALAGVGPAGEASVFTAAAAAALGGSGAGDDDDDRPAAGLVGPARVLADLDKAQMIVLQLAFWTLGVGILLGAWWADHSWGRWWAFDPKELWALVTWIVYLIVIHLRFAMGGRTRALTTAWLSVVGFFVMLWTYFGVNLLLPGLHAYA